LQQITAPKEAFRKTWSAKYTLRSHFDGVRALGFHPTEPVLITASEDQTLKLWNLQKTIPAKKSAALDVEPVYTFRAHTGAVLSLTIASSGELCFSGGIDSTIRVWNMPNPNVDPYDSFGMNALKDAQNICPIFFTLLKIPSFSYYYTKLSALLVNKVWRYLAISKNSFSLSIWLFN
jgi:WD40 repeat protein